MTVLCQPLPKFLAEELLQVVARAICDRPGENNAQRDSRTRQMVYSVLGFEPRDGQEYMLASIAIGHFHMILDSFHDVFQGQSETLKLKNKSSAVAQSRTLLRMLQDLREIRRRPAARPAEARRPDPVDPPVPESETLTEVARAAPEVSPPVAAAEPAAAACPVPRPVEARRPDPVDPPVTESATLAEVARAAPEVSPPVAAAEPAAAARPVPRPVVEARRPDPVDPPVTESETLTEVARAAPEESPPVAAAEPAAAARPVPRPVEATPPRAASSGPGHTRYAPSGTAAAGTRSAPAVTGVGTAAGAAAPPASADGHRPSSGKTGSAAPLALVDAVRVSERHLAMFRAAMAALREKGEDAGGPETAVEAVSGD